MYLCFIKQRNELCVGNTGYSYSGENISNFTILQAEYFKIMTWWDKLDSRFGISAPKLV